MRRVLLLSLPLWLMSLPAAAASCGEVVGRLNQSLRPSVNQAELAEMLDSLNASGNRQLPPRFVTKNQARDAGWRPGRDLWSVPGLAGKSIGGDRFGNREGQLPPGKWREADLDFKGGKRGAKRLLFSSDGRRQITVDHYRSFIEVPTCK